jgi:hypothetical protein
MSVSFTTSSKPRDSSWGDEVIHYFIDSGTLEDYDGVLEGSVHGVLQRDFDIFKKGWHVIIEYKSGRNCDALSITGAHPDTLKKIAEERDMSSDRVYISNDFKKDPRMTHKLYSFVVNVNMKLEDW